jgi:hypothetical protein
MAIQVNSTVKQSTRVYKVGVTLTSRTPIATPEYFVIHDPDTVQEIIAKAGLPATTVFVSALLLSSGYVGSEYYYELLITVDPLPSTATSHFHDSSTLHHPLREAYRDGPYIDLDPTLGPVDIYALAANTVDYLRVHLGSANLLFIRRDSTIQLGAHLEYTVDTTYDIGSVDNGITLRRPRDLYVGRDSWTARSGYFGTSAKSPEYRFFPLAANPDASPAERHFYWNSTDNKPHVWNGIIDYPLDTCADCPGTFGIYDGTAVALGDVVAMQGLTAVVPAGASVLGQNPAIGVCIDKPTVAVALVQFCGEISTFVGTLVPGRRYFLSKVAGQVTDDLSGHVTGDAVQFLGVSKTDSVLTLEPGPRTVL